MPSFLERHSDNIAGVLSCFDRVIIQGTLPDICYPNAITGWFYAHKIRIFDFKTWAAPMRDQIKDNLKKIAAEDGLEIAGRHGFWGGCFRPHRACPGGIKVW